MWMHFITEDEYDPTRGDDVMKFPLNSMKSDENGYYISSPKLGIPKLYAIKLDDKNAYYYTRFTWD